LQKAINFRTVIYPYDLVIQKIIEPIKEHLVEFTENYDFLEDSLNVSFFREMLPHKDVFMSHGIADKNWRNANKVSDYDYICVSGPLWKEKMLKQGVAEEKILICGYSKLDKLFSLKKETNTDKINLLFAPTHNASNKVSAYETLLNTLEYNKEEINLIESVHPADERANMTYDNYLKADVVISDCISTLYEAWALGIPVVFPDFIVKDNIIKRYPGSFEEEIYKNGIGYHASNPKELIDMVYMAKEKGLDSNTEEFIEGIFPKNLRGKSGEVTANMLLEIANK